MILATYNINSIRIRLEALRQVARKTQADIICLQETKVEDTLFPLEAIKEMGFPYVAINGEKSYNGVAILSRQPLYDVQTTDMCNEGHKRHISARLENGVELHNLYIPAGGDIPDRGLNPKFDFKLRFVDSLTQWAEKNHKKKLIIAGDFNIAPLPQDVWSHKQLLSVVSHTPVETEALEKLRASLGWIDSSRHFVPEHEKLYSWWSYRNQDWKKSDRGRRLDHIWVTPNIAQHLKSSCIFREARDYISPSDHVPVVTEFDF